jgi:hypothetical protein
VLGPTVVGLRPMVKRRLPERWKLLQAERAAAAGQRRRVAQATQLVASYAGQRTGAGKSSLGQEHSSTGADTTAAAEERTETALALRMEPVAVAAAASCRLQIALQLQDAP